MKLGVALRAMGKAARRGILLDSALAAEAADIHELWLPDHIAIPPDDAEGSGGRYLDALACLAFLSAATERIGLGTGVLVLPYRRPLSIAKWVATIQELSNNRMRLGVGIGWMAPEFKAVGISRGQRGADADACLDLLERCFDAEDDVVTQNDQPFLFRPHPQRPPIFIGGAAPHALERAARFADGWMPMQGDPERLAPHIARLGELFAKAGKGTPEVVAIGPQLRGDPARGAETLHRLNEVGVTRVMFGSRYDTASEFKEALDVLVAMRDAAALAPD